MTTVEIPPGSGNRYRYEYEEGSTVYKGPVGDSPQLTEEEFLERMRVVYLNTSNPGKLKEFRVALEPIKVKSTSIDLPEVNADPVTVAVYKASMAYEEFGRPVLVEDTSLEVEGVDVGVNVRWLLSELPNMVGRKTRWSTILSISDGEQVRLYKGEVTGTIVPSQGVGGFGFDPYFLPDGEVKTLGEVKPEHLNARFIASENFKDEKCFLVLKHPPQWEGKWQHQN